MTYPADLTDRVSLVLVEFSPPKRGVNQSADEHVAFIKFAVNTVLKKIDIVLSP